MTLTLQLSCYNGARYLPYLFASLRAQTFRDWRLVVLDNASVGDDVALIKKYVAESGVPAELFRLEKNIGFAGAHNFLFAKHQSDYVQLLNDDAFLEPEYLEKIIAFMEAHPEVAASSGRIYRWDFDQRGNQVQGRTTIVDSLGIAVSVTGGVKDIGAGAALADTLFLQTESTPVLGVSGCLPCYRSEAVRAVSPDDHLFDGSYISYKEDVDLAFRLQAAGYTAVVVHGAVAFHRRGFGLGVRRKSSPEASYQSYRNHLWLLCAHLRFVQLFWSKCGVVPYEMAKAMYWLLKSPSYVINAFRETRTAWPKLMAKRKFVRVLRGGKKWRHRSAPVFGATLGSKKDVDIAVIMVSHDELNEECLRSLAVARQQSSLKIAVVIVDNASKKYHANEFVGKFFDDAYVILRNGDFGFGRSCNRGVREVSAEYYFFLNPDTVLPQTNIFIELYQYMQSHADVALVAPHVAYFDGRLQETCRRFPKWYMPLVQRTFLKDTAWGKRYADEFAMRDYDHASIREVDWVQGSAMCMRGAVGNIIGFFDDRFWMYFEDIDLCRRIHLFGKKIVYLPSVSIKHAHGKESAKFQNLLVNLVKNETARAHILSWLKYMWKWL